MSFRRRALFLAGLFVAVSCSDAGNPLGPDGRQPAPEPGVDNLLQMVTCTVNELSGTMSCEAQGAGMGDALGAVNIGGRSNYVVLEKTNDVSTPSEAIFDVTFKNVMNRQIMGTDNGVTPHPTGMRFFFYNGLDPAETQPKVETKIDPALPASITPITDSVPRKFSGAGTTPRAYFQHEPQILHPGETSTPKTWRFAKQNVATWSFTGYISTEVRWPKGWINITPANPVLEVAGIDTLAAHVRGGFGQVHSEKVGLDWSSSNPAVVTVTELSPKDTLAQITAVGEGTAWIKVMSSTAADSAARRDSVLVTVDNVPAVPMDSINALQNVSGRVSAARLRQGLAEGDSIVPSQTYDSEHGNAVIDAAGEFTYVADPGYSGQDTVLYDVTDGEWTVKRTLLVNVAPTHYWFVREGGAAAGGSNTQPLGSINAASDSAAAGDTIFVLRNGSNDLVGAHTLDADEALIGAGVPVAFILEATDLNEANHKDLIFQGQGVGTPLMNTGAPTLTLGGNNLVRGVNISSADAAAIHGVGFGALTVADVIVQAGGPALSLANGTLAGSFLALHSANSDSSGMSLTNVGGSLTATGSSISGAATAAFSVSGGSVAISFPGDVTHAGTGRLLQVSSHSGNASFGGALTATAGTGVLFSAAEGSYTFNGALSLNGGDAGLDVSSSGGSFTFANAAVANPTGGPAVHVVGGSPALVYEGSVTHASGRAVAVDGITADSVVLRATITSGTAATPAGTGILVQNVSGGRVALDGPVSLFTGGNQAVTLTNNTGGTVRFGGGPLTITTTSGIGFGATGGGTVNVTGSSNTISATTGRAISLANVTVGADSMLFNTVNATGAVNAVSLTSVTGGTIKNVSGTLTGVAGGAPFVVSGGNVNALWGGAITQGASAPLLSVTNAHEGALAFSGGVSASNGNGLQFDNADGTYGFTGTVTLQGGDAGIDVTNGSGGTFTFPATANIVSPSTGNLVSILNSAPTFTYSGTFTKANNNVTGILVSNNTGGSITFNGTSTKSISSGTAAAVNLASNGSASILFSGGGLSITSGTGAGFSATGGGTVQVTGGTNTTSSGGGTAVNVQNTTIGASGMSFQSITANGGANGIVLNNTGATNGLQVTGTGGAGTGGTITATSGDAVSLTSVRNVRLQSMNIQNSGGSGVYGSSVTGFSLKSSTVSGNGNAVGEAGLEFDNLLGADSVVSSTITGSAEDNLVVRNTSGTLDSLVVLNSTISSNSSIGSDGILVTAANTANATVRVRNSTFTANKGDHFQATASNSAILNVLLFQNTMTGGHATALGQGVTLGTGLTFTGTFTYDLNDNDILNGAISNAITIDHDGTTGSLMQGRVRNNVIGTSGVDLSCSAQASGIEIENGNRGTHTYAVTGNIVRRCFDRGIFLDNGDGSNVTVNATVTGNTVNELTTANARQALYVNVGAFDPNFLGATDSFTVCADIQGNTLTSHPTFASEAIRLRMRFNSRMNLPGYAGSFNNAGSEVNAYLAARNTLTASATATTTAAGAPYGYYNAGASCPTPP